MQALTLALVAYAFTIVFSMLVAVFIIGLEKAIRRFKIDP